LDFDPERGHTTLRFSYARSTADIREGLARLTQFMADRKPDRKPEREPERKTER
jgi:aspartate/methionine/tyrosine aminotransferase